MLSSCELDYDHPLNLQFNTQPQFIYFYIFSQRTCRFTLVLCVCLYMWSHSTYISLSLVHTSNIHCTYSMSHISRMYSLEYDIEQQHACTHGDSLKFSEFILYLLFNKKKASRRMLLAWSLYGVFFSYSFHLFICLPICVSLACIYGTSKMLEFNGK